MAKPIKKASDKQNLFEEDADDDISFLVDGGGGGGAMGETHSGFVFPKNLKDMTEEQKQKLHDEYMEFTKSSTASWKSGIDDYVELDPSEVLDPDSPKPKKKQHNKPGSQFSDLPDPKEVEASLKDNGSFEWDPGAGFIVDAEDSGSLSSRLDISSLPSGGPRARVLGQQEARRLAEQRRRAGMTRAQRDAEDRFSNL